MISDCVFYKKRKLLYSSCAVFLLVHLYKFTNYLPNWDSMFGMNLKKLASVHMGRWFARTAEVLTSSQYDLQWVSGIASSLFVGLTIVIILDLFNIDNKYLAAVAIFLFAAFPSMAATQNYSLWASAYMLGLFLAVLGVYISVKHNNFFYFAIPCFALSMGIYQIYILFAGSVFIYYFANILLDPKEKIAKYKALIIKSCTAFVSGGAVYLIADKLLRTIFDIELSSYQGVADAGKISLNTIASGVVRMAESSKKFFLSGGASTVYVLINIAIALLTAALMLRRVVLNRSYSVSRRILLCVMFASTIPITYSFYLVSEGVSYHVLMEIGNYLIYLIPVLLLRDYDFKSGTRTVAIATVVLLGTMGIYHFINDNIAYYQLNMSYERTYYQMTETLLKADSVNDNGYKKVAVFGKYPEILDNIKTNPVLTGAGTNSFISSQHHFIQFAKYYMNREFIGCTDEELREIEATSEYNNMAEYPYGDFVSVINDTIVIKLSK